MFDYERCRSQITGSIYAVTVAAWQPPKFERARRRRAYVHAGVAAM